MFKNNFLKSENYFSENYFEIENFSEPEANVCTDENNKPIKNCKFKDITMNLEPPSGTIYPFIRENQTSFLFRDSLKIDYDNGSYDITFTWNLGFGGANMVYKARGILNKEGTKMSYFTVGAELPDLWGYIKGYPILLRGDIDFCSKKLVITQYDKNTDESGNVTYTESVKPLYNQGVSDMYKSFYMGSHRLATKKTITINDVLEFRGIKEINFSFNLGDETCIESFKNEIKMEQFSNKQDNLKELCDGLKPVELMMKGVSELEFNKNLPIGQTYGIYSKFCLSDPAPATALEDAPAPAPGPSPDPPPTWLNKKINVIAKGIASMAQYSFTRLRLTSKKTIKSTFKISIFFVGNYVFEFESTKGKMTFPDGTKYTKYTEDLLVLESQDANLPFLGVTDLQLNMTLKSINKRNLPKNVKQKYDPVSLNKLAQDFGLDTFDISLIN